MLWIGSLSGTTVVFVLNGRLNIQTAANTKYALFVHIQIMVVCQIILDTAVTLVRILGMDLLYNFCDLLVFQLSGTLFAAKPTVVCGSGHTEHIAR